VGLFSLSAVDLKGIQLSQGFVNWRKDAIAMTTAETISEIACTSSFCVPKIAVLAMEIIRDKIIIAPFADLNSNKLFTALVSYY
jgi:hypothetical protein